MQDLRWSFFKHHYPQLCLRLHHTNAHPAQANAGTGSITTDPLDHVSTTVPIPHLTISEPPSHLCCGEKIPVKAAVAAALAREMGSSNLELLLQKTCQLRKY